MRCHSLPLIAFWRCSTTSAPPSAGLTVPVNVTLLRRAGLQVGRHDAFGRPFEFDLGGDPDAPVPALGAAGDRVEDAVGGEIAGAELIEASPSVVVVPATLKPGEPTEDSYRVTVWPLTASLPALGGQDSWPKASADSPLVSSRGATLSVVRQPFAACRFRLLVGAPRLRRRTARAIRLRRHRRGQLY